MPSRIPPVISRWWRNVVHDRFRDFWMDVWQVWSEVLWRPRCESAGVTRSSGEEIVSANAEGFESKWSVDGTTVPGPTAAITVAATEAELSSFCLCSSVNEILFAVSSVGLSSCSGLLARSHGGPEAVYIVRVCASDFVNTWAVGVGIPMSSISS